MKENVGLVVAVATAVSGGIGWVANAWANGKRITVDGKRALSQSEAEFREDVIERLSIVERREDDCRRDRDSCRSELLTTRGELAKVTSELESMRIEIRRLSDALAQRTLPFADAVT